MIAPRAALERAWLRVRIGAGLVLAGAALGQVRPWAWGSSPPVLPGSVGAEVSAPGRVRGEPVAATAGGSGWDAVVTVCQVAAAVLALVSVLAVWWCWRSGTWRPGLASRWDLWRDLSKHAARGTARRTRPVLMSATWVRRRLPGGARALRPAAYGTRLGRVPRTGVGVWVSHEEATYIEAPPREGKSGQLANRIVDAPGAVVACSTKPDTAALTLPLRRRLGRVEVLNPELLGDLPSTFRWCPVAGCGDPAVADRRAAAMIGAAPLEDISDGSLWTEQAASMLRCLLHAAALAGHGMAKVAAWSRADTNDTAVTILAKHPGAAPGWAESLDQMYDLPDKSRKAVFLTLRSVLSWTDHAPLLEAVSPAPGEGFDVEAFAASSGTLYMIGSDRKGGSLAPLFSCFTTELFEAAKTLAGRSPGQRLDPPLTLVLDEAPQICPIPLPAMSADALGRGIKIHMAVQSRSQLSMRWGRDGAAAIWANMTTKIFLPSISNVEDLEEISRLVGDVTEFSRSQSHDSRGRATGGSTHRVTRRALGPEEIRMMRRGRALVLHRNTRAIVIKTRPAWARVDVRAARLELDCAARWAARGHVLAERRRTSRARAWVLTRLTSAAAAAADAPQVSIVEGAAPARLDRD